MAKKVPGGVMRKIRRKSAMDRLIIHLNNKSYTNKAGKVIKLTPNGEKRVQREIETLKTRL